MDLNKDGELGYYDEINPIFTVFEEAQEQFYQVWTKYDDDFEVFYQNYLFGYEKLPTARDKKL